MAIDKLVKTVMSELKQIVRTETVIGEPIQAGNATIVPVSKVSVGFGVGGGGGKEPKEGQEASGSGAGTGGGISIEPLAFIVVNEDGKAQFIPVTKKEATISKVFDSIPDILDKIREFQQKDEKEDQANKSE